MSAELVGRDEEIAAARRAARARAARRDRRARRHRQDRARDRDRPRRCPRAGGVWLARLEARATADEVLDALIAALNVTGGEAALLERLRGAAAVLILDNCEHVVDAAAALAVRLLDAAPGCGSSARARSRSTSTASASFELAPLALADAVELFTRRAARRRRRATRVRELCRSLDGLPLAIELAAARTQTLSIEEITRRLDDRFGVLSDPTSRRPERRRALQGDDPLELRAAVPRRPAGPVGAGHVRRRRAAARRRVRPRGARRPGVGGDRRRRTAREPSLVIVDDATGRSATGCSTASARSRSRRWPRPG